MSRPIKLLSPLLSDSREPFATIYHGDARDLIWTAWALRPEPGDSLLMDPPYGIDYDSGQLRLDGNARSIRGDKNSKRMALVFTGDEFAEGGTAIADALAKHNVQASFFLTGRFYRTRANRQIIERLKKDGHYLGPHSDAHVLYADWNDRSKSLVTREQFERDLNDNFAAMRPFGIDRKQVPFFMPPYEWYNREIADWSSALSYQIINFTPGTRSNADYTTDDDKNYISSDAIMARIKDFESKDPEGLNGFILLTHLGSGPRRTDKFHNRVDELVGWLKLKNYLPVRVDELLK